MNEHGTVPVLNYCIAFELKLSKIRERFRHCSRKFSGSLNIKLTALLQELRNFSSFRLRSQANLVCRQRAWRLRKSRKKSHHFQVTLSLNQTTGAKKIRRRMENPNPREFDIPRFVRRNTWTLSLHFQLQLAGLAAGSESNIGSTFSNCRRKDLVTKQKKILMAGHSLY